MSLPHFHLSCEHYRKNIFAGFAYLQQQQEFVDLTLAVDGYQVKVHKNIMALASPYIKDLIKKAPSENLVLYLHNVRYCVLNYLLEYIYQGEVDVPNNEIDDFVRLAQSLRVTGMAKSNFSKLEQSQETKIQEQTGSTSSMKILELDCTKQNSNRVIPMTTITIQDSHQNDDEQYTENCDVTNMPYANTAVESLADTIELRNKNAVEDLQFMDSLPILRNTDTKSDACIPTNLEIPTSKAISEKRVEIIDDIQICPGTASENVVVTNSNQETENLAPYLLTVKPLCSDQEKTEEIPPTLDLNCELDKDSMDALKIISQFTVTERGSIQIIVGRYLYNSHHSSRGGRKHRWRCSDYRKKHCPAFIDSVDNHIVLRKGVHKHAYHDDKIYKKHEKNQIFYSLRDAETASKLPSSQPVNLDKPENLDFEKSIDCKVIPKQNVKI